MAASWLLRRVLADESSEWQNCGNLQILLEAGHMDCTQREGASWPSLVSRAEAAKGVIELELLKGSTDPPVLSGAVFDTPCLCSVFLRCLCGWPRASRPGPRQKSILRIVGRYSGWTLEPTYSGSVLAPTKVAVRNSCPFGLPEIYVWNFSIRTE